jgi:hypothetical protein
MKCPKCGYVSYDYLDACRKCSVDLVEFKKTLQLDAVRPGDLDLSVVLAERAEQMGGTDAFHMDDDFFSAQTMLVEREEPVDEAEEEFDINLDDDGPEIARRADFPPGVARHTTAIDDVDSFAEAEEDDVALRPLSAAPSMPAAAPVTPVDMIDMSDLEDLDGIDINLEEVPEHTEAIVSGEDTVIMQNFAIPMAEEPSESDAADITFSLAEADDDEASTPVVPPQTVPAAATDDPVEADLELQLEAEEEQWSAEPEADLQIDLDAFDLSDDDEEDRPKQP